MSVTAGSASRLRRGCYGLIVGGLLSAVTSAMIALPVANADPSPQCTDVGETIDSYLNRHPEVRQELASKGQQESPGSPDPVLEYLNHHPDVRQNLIKLSHQCVP